MRYRADPEVSDSRRICGNCNGGGVFLRVTWSSPAIQQNQSKDEFKSFPDREPSIVVKFSLLIRELSFISQHIPVIYIFFGHTRQQITYFNDTRPPISMVIG